MLFPQFVEGVTLKPRFMVSAWLRRDVEDAIMSQLRRKSRASGALERGSGKSGCRCFAQRRAKLLESIASSAFRRFRLNAT
jgi:hypothetical protein